MSLRFDAIKSTAPDNLSANRESIHRPGASRHDGQAPDPHQRPAPAPSPAGQADGPNFCQPRPAATPLSGRPPAGVRGWATTPTEGTAALMRDSLRVPRPPRLAPYGRPVPRTGGRPTAVPPAASGAAPGHAPAPSPPCPTPASRSIAVEGRRSLEVPP